MKMSLVASGLGHRIVKLENDIQLSEANVSLETWLILAKLLDLEERLEKIEKNK